MQVLRKLFFWGGGGGGGGGGGEKAYVASIDTFDQAKLQHCIVPTHNYC